MPKYALQKADGNLLIEKVEAVMNAFSLLHVALGGGALPKNVAETISFIRNRFAFFSECVENGLIEPEFLDRAVDAAENIANGGGNIVYLIKNSSLADAAIFEQDTLSEVAQDLKDYCAAHAVELSSPVGPPRLITVGPRTGDHEKLLKDLAEAQGRLETAERALGAVEARLTALNETAGRTSERVEETLARQTESVRIEVNKKTDELSDSLAVALKAIGERSENFKNYESKAEKILGVMSNKLLAHGYAGSAKSEESAANFFRLLSIALMAATFAMLSSTLYGFGQGYSDWEGAIVRIVISIILTIPTAYLAREAGKHRAQAVELRRTALDFLALNPYLAEMAQGVSRDELKAELAKKIFFLGDKADSSSSFPVDTQAVIMKLLDVAQDAVRKK